MSEIVEKIWTRRLRPIDCAPAFINQFSQIVLQDGSATTDSLRQEIPFCEMLFFTGVTGKLMGVSAIRYANDQIQRKQFEKAGIAKLCDPLSVEICWFSILPEFQDQGVATHNLGNCLDYLSNRPCYAYADKSKILSSILEQNEEFSMPESGLNKDQKDIPAKIYLRNHQSGRKTSEHLQYG